MVKEIYFRAQPKSGNVNKAIYTVRDRWDKLPRKCWSRMQKPHCVVGFIEDSSYKIGKNLDGLPIYGASSHDLSRILKSKQVNQLYIAIDKLSVDKKSWIQICVAHSI